MRSKSRINRALLLGNIMPTGIEFLLVFNPSSTQLLIKSFSLQLKAAAAPADAAVGLLWLFVFLLLLVVIRPRLYMMTSNPFASNQDSPLFFLKFPKCFLGGLYIRFIKDPAAHTYTICINNISLPESRHMTSISFWVVVGGFWPPHRQHSLHRGYIAKG